MTFIMKVITHMGDTIVVVSVCLLLFTDVRIRKKVAIPVTIAVILSAMLNVILKNIIARPRPDTLRLITEAGYSFPSGHAMINMTLYASIALLTIKYVKDKTAKIFIIICSAIITVLIGISRVYLGVHYITDILGGWCIGFIIAIFVYRVFNKLVKEE